MGSVGAPRTPQTVSPLLSPARPASHGLLAGPGWEGREPREAGWHKGPFVPVARARLYLLSPGKQEVPGGLSCYDNLTSPFFPS